MDHLGGGCGRRVGRVGLERRIDGAERRRWSAITAQPRTPAKTIGRVWHITDTRPGSSPQAHFCDLD
jgi:hypothetical protein